MEICNISHYLPFEIKLPSLRLTDIRLTGNKSFPRLRVCAYFKQDALDFDLPCHSIYRVIRFAVSFDLPGINRFPDAPSKSDVLDCITNERKFFIDVVEQQQDQSYGLH